MNYPYDFSAKQKRLRQIVCCPNCTSDLTEADASIVSGYLLSANLLCNKCGTVGHVCNGRFLFTGENFVRYGKKFQSDNHIEIVSRPLNSIAENACGIWQPSTEFVWSDEAGSKLCFTTAAVGLNIDLLAHSWAGIVEIAIDEQTIKEVDLFEPDGSMRVSIPLFLGRGKHQVTLTATGRKHVGSHAAQCHVLGVQEVMESSARKDNAAVLTGNRGNPYPGVWSDILAQAPADALILDCGAGDRCYPDDRVMNFEYCAFGLPDIYGDGHAIPIKDNSFDIILSQAVFEHLYDPKKAASEIQRILKPGGFVYVESAFMQPLHAVPFHFFNTTPWGLEKLFEDLDRDEVVSHGTLTQTLQWIYSLCDIEGRGGKAKLDNLLTLSSELDALITQDEMRKFSSFVSLVGRKKVLN